MRLFPRDIRIKDRFVIGLKIKEKRVDIRARNMMIITFMCACRAKTGEHGNEAIEAKGQ